VRVFGTDTRALDERLHRPVALKVLPEDYASDPDRKRRFLREARAAAAVTHPNVATIYEVGEVEGRLFIAMEFVDGGTLRDRLTGGPQAVGTVLRIGIAAAQGLARAHAAGLVHRDLKPENIGLTLEGQVKLLDFGLAKRLPLDSGTPARTSMPSVWSCTRSRRVVAPSADARRWRSSSPRCATRRRSRARWGSCCPRRSRR
jgi:serine/threonine protein kinase